MKRIPLSEGYDLHSGSRVYRIREKIGDGANSIVYEAYYRDSRDYCHHVRIKECYPFRSDIARNDENGHLAWGIHEERDRDMKLFEDSYAKLAGWQKKVETRNSTVNAYDIFEANNTRYIVMDADAGKPFDAEQNASLRDNIRTVLAVAKVVKKYHDDGYLHLDIKPSNILVIPETRELVILFDLDTVVRIEDIHNRRATVSFSQGFAAPEQIRGNINAISERTDIFSLGAVLFEKIMGRQPLADDMSLFSEWNFPERIFRYTNPKIKRMLRDIFKKTLAVNPKNRFEDADELIMALEEAAYAALNKEPYILSNIPVTYTNFVGREKELAEIDRAFDEGKRIVFLRGIGGIGKTDIARKYAHDNSSRYDVILLLNDVDSIHDGLDNVEIQNFYGNEKEHRKAITHILNSRALVVIDNYRGNDLISVADKYPCKFLVTTRLKMDEHIADNGSCQTMNVGCLSRCEQLKLFELELNRTLTEDEKLDVNQILEKISGNTFLIMNIARMVKNDRENIHCCAVHLADNGIKGLPETTVRFEKDGYSYNGSVLSNAKTLYDWGGLSDVAKTLLCFVKTFCNVMFEREYLLKTLDDDYSEALESLFYSCWLMEKTYANGNYIEMHDIIKEVIDDEDYVTSRDNMVEIEAYQIRKMLRGIKENIPMSGYQAKSEYTGIWKNSYMAKAGIHFEMIVLMIKDAVSHGEKAVDCLEDIILNLNEFYENDFWIFHQYPIDIMQLVGKTYENLSKKLKFICSSIALMNCVMKTCMTDAFMEIGTFKFSIEDMEITQKCISEMVINFEGESIGEGRRKMQDALAPMFGRMFARGRVTFPRRKEDVERFLEFRVYLADVGKMYWKNSSWYIDFCLGIEDSELYYDDEMDYRFVRTDSWYDNYERFDYDEYLADMTVHNQIDDDYDDDWCEDLYGKYLYEEMIDDELSESSEMFEEDEVEKQKTGIIDKDASYADFIRKNSAEGCKELLKVIQLIRENKNENAEKLFLKWAKNYLVSGDVELEEEHALEEIHNQGGDWLLIKFITILKKTLESSCVGLLSEYDTYYRMADVYHLLGDKDMVKEIKMKMYSGANRDFIIG